MSFLVQLEEIQDHIVNKTVIDTKVSQKNVAWHLEHMLLTAKAIFNVVLASDPRQYKWRLNPGRTLILKTGIIPRGQGKAPKFVRPKEEKVIEDADILRRIEALKVQVKEVEVCNPKAYFDHPYFGLMKRDEAIAFTKIHTEHHLKIVRDILKKQGSQ